MAELKSILDKIEFGDDAKVQRQLADQVQKVKLRLSRIRHKIFIMSGKGGVGKSTVTAQLALALARKSFKVGILDADLNGPSIPLMLGLEGKTWSFHKSPEVEPLEGPLGIKVASMAFLLKKAEPIRWKGPMDLTPVWLGMMESSTLREFLGDVRWGTLDFLLLDLPPGAAADKPPAILQYMPDMDGAVFVTTGSGVSRSVVERSKQYALDLGIRVLGVVENFSNLFTSPDIQGQEVLGRVPFDADLSKSLDSGKPLVAGHPIGILFSEIAQKLVGKILIPESKTLNSKLSTHDSL
ncbi:MAG: P-loop NTPase [Elusimicrobia bacterium]|nr:P-loop NTPase [Elusimicrobiota bacterium]